MNPPAENPSVAIIVPNFNGRDDLDACLGSLLEQDYPDFSVTLVDNASTDASVAFVKQSFPQVSVVENSHNLGYAGGCNAGLKRALRDDATYFVIVNSDTRAGEGWLRELVEAAAADEAIGVAQSIVYVDEPGEPVVNTAGNEMHYLGFAWCGGYRQPDRGQFAGGDIPYGSGASLLVKREVLEQVGLFDEDLFLYHEDLDLCLRVRLAGYRIVLAPASHIYHDYDFSRNRSKFYYLERNRMVVLLKSYSLRSLAVLSPALLGAEIAMLGYSLAGGWFLDKLRGYGYLMRNMGGIAEKRRRVQSLRRESDRRMLSYCSARMSFPDLKSNALTRVANPVSQAYWKLARRLI